MSWGGGDKRIFYAGSGVCKGDGGWLRRVVRARGCVASCDELRRIDSIWRVELNSANSGLSLSLSLSCPSKAHTPVTDDAVNPPIPVEPFGLVTFSLLLSISLLQRRNVLH
jgi:hypothetical protein